MQVSYGEEIKRLKKRQHELKGAVDTDLALLEKHFSDTLEERKKRIKTMWVFGLLYTHKWLTNWLNDKTNSDVTVYIKDYCLNVLLPATSNFLQIINTLIKYVPVNLFIKPKIKYQAFVRIETGVLMRTHIKQSLLCATVNVSDILSGDETTILTDENGNLLYDNFKYLQLEG